jgi:hypothetical protein
MTTSSPSSIKPGDVIIEEIQLESYAGFKMSLMGLFENFSIYEDIYANCMTGNITIIDSMNLVRHLPIIGAETLTITYHTPETPFRSTKRVRLKFRTYKISMYMETAQPSTMLVRLEFISPHAVRSMQTKISKSYKNMPVSKMVEQIYMETLASDPNDTPTNSTARNAIISTAVGTAATMVAPPAGMVIGGLANSPSSKDQGGNKKMPIAMLQETADTGSYVIPYWNPLYTINWLSQRARAKTNPTYCDFVFYENSDGHHFVALSQLKESEPSFVYTNYPKGLRSNSGDRMIEYEMRNVLSMNIQDYTDKIRQQNMGVFASSIVAHDLTTKSFNTYRFNYDRDYPVVGNHIENNGIIPINKTDYSSAFMSAFKYYPSSTFTMTGLERISDPGEIVLYRQSLLNQMGSVNLVLECHGDTNVKVGQIIQFNTIAKESTKTSTRFDDDYIKGKYMVTAIRHVVTDRSHRMTLTVSKDSFAEPIASIKKDEFKRITS